MSRKMTNRECIKRYFPPSVSKKILGYASKDSLRFWGKDFLQSTKIGDGSIERNCSNIVHWAFLWTDTNEGFDYWNKIHEKLVKAGK